MKPIAKHIFIIRSIGFVAMVMVSCKSVKEVAFETPVDTTSKEITFQKKQEYFLEEAGVHASNQFDGARLNDFIKLNDSTARVLILPENKPINRSPYYAFKTWSDNPRTYYFSFEYPIGYKHRYTPKLMKNGSWQTIDSTDVLKRDSLITIRVELDKSPLLISAQELQNTTHVKNWYTELLKPTKNYIHFTNFGRSKLGRDLPVLDIYKGEKRGKPIVVIMTRQHPPEVTGYYAFQEFLQTILSDSDLSNEFLENYRVLAFPILNPDGVDLGHWRHNAGGVDTNRDWAKYNQPEIKQTVKFINGQLKKDKAKLILGIDFHSTYEDVFYTNVKREGTSLPYFIDQWFAALEKKIPGYKVNEEPGNSTKPVSKGWFLYGHNATAITYEIGDKTPKEFIKSIGTTSANEMMRILMTETN